MSRRYTIAASILAAEVPAGSVVKVCGESVFVKREGEVVERADTPDPLARIDAFCQRFRVPDGGGRGTVRAYVLPG